MQNAFAQVLSDLPGANSATSSDSSGNASKGATNPQATLPDGRWSLDRQFPKEDLFLQKSKFEYIWSIACNVGNCGVQHAAKWHHQFDFVPPSTILIHAILWNLR
jgi:hypothetical protein